MSIDIDSFGKLSWNGNEPYFYLSPYTFEIKISNKNMSPGNKAIDTILDYVHQEDLQPIIVHQDNKQLQCDTYRTVIIPDPPKISWLQKIKNKLFLVIYATVSAYVDSREFLQRRE